MVCFCSKGPKDTIKKKLFAKLSLMYRHNTGSRLEFGAFSCLSHSQVNKNKYSSENAQVQGLDLT